MEERAPDRRSRGQGCAGSSSLPGVRVVRGLGRSARIVSRAGLAGVIALSACTVRPVDPAVGPVPLARGSASAFTPLVTRWSGSAQCSEPSAAPLDLGARAVALVFSGEEPRQITVTVGPDGTPRRYVDVRGDLSESDGRSRDRTTIALYLDQDYAVLSNREGAGPPKILEVPLAEALDAPQLGNPSEMIERVLALCGTGAPAAV